MNRIIETPDGYDVVVDGVRHGSWRSRSEASAGMATEVARAKERDDAESERLIAATDAETQRQHEWRNRA